jgi:sugar lactone lactonase YvrE
MRSEGTGKKRARGLPAATLAVAFTMAAGMSAQADAPSTVDAAVAAAGHRIEVLATGSRISGANGMQVGPDGRLYVASVVGSELLVLDTADGRVVRRFTHADGVEGPDDVAFAPDGSVYWTSILSGEVAGFRPDGTRVVAARIGPGVNPLTFSPSGRLFVAQCFFGTGLFEVDPDGVEPPRVIRDDLGPRCGLNGMDWGPDGRLYGPRWFRGEVVSIDVDTGEMRTELTGVQVPAAVKFDSTGRLHVLDTLAGQVLRVKGGAGGAVRTVSQDAEVVARFPPGLDNFAFDSADTLYVSSFVDGFVARVNADGTQTMLSPAGMSSPGGVAVRITAEGVEAVVADLQALRGFDASSGKVHFTEANVLGVSPMGTALNVSIDGEHLVLASWVDNDVRVWSQREQRVVERHEGLQEPVAAVRFGGGLAIAEHKAGRVILMQADGQFRVLASGLAAPTGLVVRGDDLYLTERSQGMLLRLVTDGAPLARPETVIDGLAAPEGVALYRDGFAIVEAGTGAVTVVDGEGRRTTVATLPVGLPAGSAAQPPSFVFNGIASMGDGGLIVTDERSRALLRIVPVSP